MKIATRPVLSIIAAMAQQRVIGIENRLPWKLPADMAWFRRHTLGKPIVMGRKTLESFAGRTLPDRLNVVVTGDPNYQAPQGVVVTHSIEEALNACGDVEEVMIIGGESFYRQTLPLAGRLYLTLVDAQIEGDAYFPAFDGHDWHEVLCEERQADEANPYGCRFTILEPR